MRPYKAVHTELILMKFADEPIIKLLNLWGFFVFFFFFIGIKVVELNLRVTMIFLLKIDLLCESCIEVSPVITSSWNPFYK